METLFIILILAFTIVCVASFLKIRALITEKDGSLEKIDELSTDIETLKTSLESVTKKDDQSQKEMKALMIKLESLEGMKIWKKKYDEAYEQIQKMYKESDELLVIIDSLTVKFEDLKEYSYEVYNASREMYLFLLEKLKHGFLEDNEDVHDLANRMKTFIIQGQSVQEKYGSLFLVEDEGEESEDVEILENDELEDDGIDIDVDEFLDDIDTDDEYFNKEEEIEYFDDDDEIEVEESTDAQEYTIKREIE